MSEQNEQVITGRITTAYGIYLAIDDDLRQQMAELHRSDAERCVEIVVKIDGVVHEMTLAQFAKRIAG